MGRGRQRREEDRKEEEKEVGGGGGRGMWWCGRDPPGSLDRSGSAHTRPQDSP